MRRTTSGAYTWTLGGLVTFLSLAGCGPKHESLPTVPVTGTVTYNGQPLADAQISFVAKGTEGRSAGGRTDANGNFKLETYLGGNTSASGALPGEYQVSVRKREELSGSMGGGNTGPDLNKMREEENKDADVKGSSAAPSGPPGVPRPPKAGATPSGDMAKFMAGGGAVQGKSLIPERYERATESELTATVKPSGNEPFKFELTD